LEEYRAEWDGWVQKEGFAVLDVKTDVKKVQMLGDAAVLTHSVKTRQRTNAGEETVHERETIVLARQHDGGWLVVHEHLSPDVATKALPL
jgi:ketosteroid isomerase-like protein